MRFIVCTLALLVAAPAAAEILNGSDGSLGVLNVTSSTTIPLPANGKLNYTTIFVASGTTVTFLRNSLNTPAYLLATGDVVINGAINVDGANGSSVIGGAGGPGGFDGGTPGFGGIAAGPGHGPGGGLAGISIADAGHGSYGTRNGSNVTNDGAVYGSALLVPLVGGSGSAGGADTGGGGGGGALLIASETRITLAGAVYARGGHNGYQCGTNEANGSGGGVRLVAPRIDGAGSISALGGTYCGARGGHGRVRFDAIDRTGLSISVATGPTVSHGTFLAAFPNVLPRLDLISLGGDAIAGGSAVTIMLPFGSSPTQTIELRAQDFGTGGSRAFVRLEPDSGAPTLLGPFMIANNTISSIEVTLPVNNTTRVMVWGEPQ